VETQETLCYPGKLRIMSAHVISTELTGVGSGWLTEIWYRILPHRHTTLSHLL